MTKVQIRIRMDEAADLEVAQSAANERPDLQMEAVAGVPANGIEILMEPVTAVLIGAAVVTVAKFVMDWWEKRRGGLVIDMRDGEKDQIYRNPAVSYGFAVIFPADGGLVKIETHDMPKDAMQQLLEAVISGVFKSVTDIAKAAKDALPKATVEETPATETA